jgi:hypothetical protein
MVLSKGTAMLNLPAAPPAPSEQQDRLEDSVAVKGAKDILLRFATIPYLDDVAYNECICAMPPAMALLIAEYSRLLSRIEKARKLADKYNRRVRVDCDPANGSAEVQIRGRLEAEFSKQLLTALLGDDKP